MEKDELYYCVLDCYFKALDDDLTYYKISDKELSKLIINVKELEFERNQSNARWRRYSKSCNEKIKRLEHEKHVYKVELGRCVRKLTRIYEHKMELAVLAYALGKLPEKPHEYVDRWRNV